MDSNHLTTYWEREEEENSKKGLIGSVCFHSILLLLFLLPWFKTADPPPSIPGVLVSMGNPDLLDAEEPSPQKSTESLTYQKEESVQEAIPPAVQVEKKKPIKPSTASVPKPTKEVPAKFEKTVEQVQEESPVQIKEVKKKSESEAIKELERKNEEAAKREQEKLEKIKEAQEETQQQAEAAAKARAVAKAKQKQAEEAARKKQEAYEKTKNELGSLFGGDRNSDESEGKKGDPDGSNDSKILEGLSGGLGEVGGGLSGRGIVYEPVIKENSQKVGKVVVKVCVDKSGSVISSKFTQRGSTTTDSQLVDVAQKAAAKYKFTPGDLAEQCGTITIDFKLK